MPTFRVVLRDGVEEVEADELKHGIILLQFFRDGREIYFCYVSDLISCYELPPKEAAPPPPANDGRMGFRPSAQSD